MKREFQKVLVLSILFLFLISNVLAEEYIVNYLPFTGSSEQLTTQIQAQVIREVSTPEPIQTNFIASGSADLDVCACSQSTDIIRIKNSNPNTRIYTLSSNLNFVDVSPSKFQLVPNQVQEVLLTINAPCKTSFKDLKLRLKSNFGDDLTISKSLEIGRCQNLDVSLETQNSSANPCETVDYQINVRNTGSFSEIYSLTSNIDSFVDYTSSRFELNANEYTSVNASVTFPCDVFGSELVEFYVEAERNYLEAVVSHDLTIDQNYDYSFTGPSSVLFCEEEPETLDFVLRNDVLTPNTYLLSLEGAPDFVSLSHSSVELDGGAFQDIAIFVNFWEADVYGEYNFTINSETIYGGASISRDVTLTVSDCYNIDIQVEEETVEFCSEQRSVPFTIFNNGEFSEDVVLDSSLDFATLIPSRVNLDSGENFTGTLVFDPEDVDFEDDLTVSSSIDGREEVVQDSLDVTVYSQNTCHAVEFSDLTHSIRRDTQNNVSFDLRNIGFEDGDYEVILDSTTEWLELLENEFSIAASNSTVVTLISNHPANANFWKYPFNLTVEYDDLEYSFNGFLILQDKPLVERAFNYFYKHPCQFVTLILLGSLAILFLVFLFLRKPKGKVRTKSLEPFVFTLGLILLVFFILIFNLVGPPTLNPIDKTNASDTHFIWAQDNVYEISFDDFVFDPDSEDEVEQLIVIDEDEKNISLSYDDKDITFIPDAGWFGVQEMNILAIDSRNASSVSPTLTLEVVEVQEYTLWESYLILCWYINWLLLLLCFLFLSLIAFKRFRGKASLFRS